MEDVIQELESQFGAVEHTEQKAETILNGFENTLYGMLSEEPIHIDLLARQSNRTTSEVLSTLLTLELMGIVKQLSGKMFVKLSH